MDKAIKRQKIFEVQTIAGQVDAGGRSGGMQETPQRKGSYMNKEESIQVSTTRHLQGNGTFGGP